MGFLNWLRRAITDPLVRWHYFWLTISIFNGVLAIWITLVHWDTAKTLALAEVIKALSSITWPALIFLAGWIFRDEVRTLVRQTQEFGPQGYKRVPVQIDTRSVDELLRRVDPLNRYPDYLTNISQEIQTQMAKVSDAGTRETEQVMRLADALATSRALDVYLRIFRSQLDALTAMVRTQGPVDLQPYYSAHSEQVAKISRGPGEAQRASFEGWSAYLTTQGLITLDGHQGRATQFGQDFILYVEKYRQISPFHAL